MALSSCSSPAAFVRYANTPRLAASRMKAGSSARISTITGQAASRTTDPAAFNKFLDAGYGVISFDQRGFGESGGHAYVENPDVEGHDVRRLVLAPRSDRADVGLPRDDDMTETCQQGGDLIEVLLALIGQEHPQLTPRFRCHSSTASPAVSIPPPW